MSRPPYDAPRSRAINTRMNPRLHDSHNHLQDPLLNPWRADFLGSREANGIGYQVVNGTSEADWGAVRALADGYPEIIPSFGVHPWKVDDVSEDWQCALLALLDEGGCVGEIGLDRWKTTDNFETQRDVFRWQWNEATKRALPATVHCIRAWGALMDIIREAPHRSPGFLLHAYSGPVEMLDDWVELGAYFSFSASFLAEGRERKLEPFRAIPANRLLVETDAPSMPPPPDLLVNFGASAEIHHPGAIRVAYEGLAQTRAESMATLTGQVNENFERLFCSR